MLMINKISIHALREESDELLSFLAPLLRLISIHALREESDSEWFSLWFVTPKFQSTLSVRRATLNHIIKVIIKLISIHALREESD